MNHTENNGHGGGGGGGRAGGGGGGPPRYPGAARVAETGFVEVKSKFDAEFRRFSIDRSKYRTFEDFHRLLSEIHLIRNSSSFLISYIDPKDNDLLPINNTDNYLRSLKGPLLRLVIQRKGEAAEESFYYGKSGQRSLLNSVLGNTSKVPGSMNQPSNKMISISQPSEFRQVAAIIDMDVVPETCRRVRLLKHGSDKPLGFYIRDGTSVRVTPAGLEKVPGIFISRLVPGGLAESTGLLAVNDEVLEVNGIEVAGKSLDQVTDMMVANSSNLIITVKPANQRTTLAPPRRGSFSRNSNVSHGSMLSKSSSRDSQGRGGHNDRSTGSGDVDHDDEDEIRDLTALDSLDTTHKSYASKKQVLHL